MIDSEVTLLPQPDSPTSPSTSPVSIVKLTRSTARSRPWLVANWVSSASTESSGGTSGVSQHLDRVALDSGPEEPVGHGIHQRDPPFAAHLRDVVKSDRKIE